MNGGIKCKIRDKSVFYAYVQGQNAFLHSYADTQWFREREKRRNCDEKPQARPFDFVQNRGIIEGFTRMYENFKVGNEIACK